MPKISDARREARRTQILEAFRRCVAREGFHRTSMAAVIHEAGLSAGAVYGHFKSKTALIHAVSQEVLGFATSQLRELADRPGRVTVEEVYGTFLLSALEVYGEVTPSIAVQVWAELGRDDEVRHMAANHLENLREVLAILVTRCQASGTLPPGDPQKMARAVLGLLPGYVLQQVVHRDLSPADYVEGAVALVGPPRAEP